MPLQLHDLQDLLGAPLGGPTPVAQAGVPVGLCTDSRRLQPGEVFIPLVGESFDGHSFVSSAIAAGARAVVLQPERLDRGDPSTLNTVIQLAEQRQCLLWSVADTLEAYQGLARRARQQLAAPVVAVTGSAGKTTTRELIRAALASLGPVVASSGNENNDVGAPLTLLRAEPDTAAVVVEMGMRGPGEIGRLSRCAEPNVAVITNIGTAHIGRLGSREAIASAKCEISEALSPEGVLVIPAADPLLEAALAPGWGGRVVRVALADEPLGLPGVALSLIHI